MSLFDGSQKPCIAICTPMPGKQLPDGSIIGENVTVRWHRHRMGLAMPTNINTSEVVVDYMEVGHARSHVAARLLQQPRRQEFVFFLDWDVLASYDALTKLFYRARCYPDIDIFAGVYCAKWQNPPSPLIYGENGQGSLWNWKVGDLITTDSHDVKSVHMGLTLIRTRLFQKMIDQGRVHGTGDNIDDEPFFKTEASRSVNDKGEHLLCAGTEDIYFCQKAMLVGAKIMVDTSVLAGHEDKNTGIVYGLPYDDGPSKRTLWMPGADGRNPDRVEADKAGMKMAIDIGAGEDRRVWPGHITYTTDLRADTKPDYIQDTRWLNLPDNHYDLVASSHHLEHIPRLEQERVWAEIYRICKPGGVIEHILPNIEWAANKIAEGEVDEHVYNVLYGAQEAHGYARELNLHYFGYTRSVAIGLAEKAGFIDVVCRDWQDDPNLTYNLILTGRKPRPDEAEAAKRDAAREKKAAAKLAAELAAGLEKKRAAGRAKTARYRAARKAELARKGK